MLIENFDTLRRALVFISFYKFLFNRQQRVSSPQSNYLTKTSRAIWYLIFFVSSVFIDLALAIIIQQNVTFWHKSKDATMMINYNICKGFIQYRYKWNQQKICQSNLVHRTEKLSCKWIEFSIWILSYVITQAAII